MRSTYEVNLEFSPEEGITCTQPSALGPAVQTGVNPAGCREGTPMDHLGVALGSCLLHFAQHFMARRATPVPCRIAITCAVDQNRCEIQSLDADLALELTLSEEDRGVLLRMLRQCPIHKALDVWTPVNLRVTDQQGA